MYVRRFGGGNTFVIATERKKGMDVSLILRIAGVGVLVSVVASILNKSGRDEQSMLLTVAGILTVMLMLVEEIGTLLDSVRTVFGF